MVFLSFFLKAIFAALLEARKGKKCIPRSQTNLCLLGMSLNNPSAASKSGEAHEAFQETGAVVRFSSELNPDDAPVPSTGTLIDANEPAPQANECCFCNRWEQIPSTRIPPRSQPLGI